MIRPRAPAFSGDQADGLHDLSAAAEPIISFLARQTGRGEKSPLFRFSSFWLMRTGGLSPDRAIAFGAIVR